MLIKAGIFGAASLTAGKLIKLLLDHPNVEINYLTSATYEGQGLYASFRGQFKNLLPLTFESYNKNKMTSKCDIVFLSKPHAQHVNYAEELLEAGLKVIDLSADFRLKDAKEFETWYKPKEKYYYDKSYFKWLDEAVYGLPEIYADKIKNAKLVANPGCYPTSVILGLFPLFKSKVALTENIIVNSYSGVSGAGKSREKETQFIDLNENIKPYKYGSHNHTPEMEQELSNLCGSKCKVLFTPHVMPIDVGIVSDIYVQLKKQLDIEEILKLYNDFYKDKKLVRIYEKDNLPNIKDVEGTNLPNVKDVAGTNFCDIGITLDKRTNWCIITSVIDNTMKGAAGQAIQNMNLMFGLEEITGLPFSNALKKQDITKLSKLEPVLP